MNVALSYVLEPDTPLLKELDRVALLVDASTDEGKVIPAGSEGTIVGIWQRGLAYEVEFSRPSHALATVRIEHLRKLIHDEG